MEANAVTPFVNTYALPTGRRVFLGKEVQARAAKRDVQMRLYAEADARGQAAAKIR